MYRRFKTEINEENLIDRNNTSDISHLQRCKEAQSLKIKIISNCRTDWILISKCILTRTSKLISHDTNYLKSPIIMQLLDISMMIELTNR